LSTSKKGVIPLENAHCRRQGS